MKTSFTTQRNYARSRGAGNTFGDFTCLVCGALVSASLALSGVHNRNHCPYCLSSRHLDLFEAGDRLSACKAPMKAVALVQKRANKRYESARQGELMLAHLCRDCGKLSINRIAADDDNATLLTVFDGADDATRGLLASQGIDALGPADRRLVMMRLFGQN